MGEEYREEVILNVTVIFVRVCGIRIKRGNDTECYLDYCEGLVEWNIDRN